ncbi:MAG: 3-deoxy-D-manno-octulosonic acid transferase [Odoribacter sp.]|nr:3-deoxy-D-manno-octulosonic acid transferase [Odoribacter sp.]
MAAPFNKKAALWRDGRKNIRKEIFKIKKDNRKLVWFHAASLGEFEQGRPVIEALKEKEPECKILLTFFSPSGYEVRKNYQQADYILYLPADTSANARFFIEHIQPDVAVFIKYEFWYNYLYNLYKNQIPVYLISAIFRKEQPFFKSWGKLHRKMLQFFSRIFVQDKESVSLLKSIGINHVELAGDTRFDRVNQIAQEAKIIEKAEHFLQGAPTVVCGSTWQQDEEMLLSYINQYEGEYKFIMAPHEISDSHIRSIISALSVKVVKYSENTADYKDAKVLLIDCIGILSVLYRYGKIAYIGGGFGAGIHNTLEAAVYGIPVIFGPKYKKFQEAVCLIQEGAGFMVKDKNELYEVLNTLIDNPEIAEVAGKKASEYVKTQLGSTEIIVKYLIDNL